MLFLLMALPFIGALLYGQGARGVGRNFSAALAAVAPAAALVILLLHREAVFAVQVLECTLP